MWFGHFSKISACVYTLNKYILYIYIYIHLHVPSGIAKMIRQLDIENVKVWQGLTGLMTGLVDSSPLSTTLGSAVASTPQPSFMTARSRSSSAFSAAGDDRDDMASGRNTIPFYMDPSRSLVPLVKPHTNQKPTNNGKDSWQLLRQ